MIRANSLEQPQAEETLNETARPMLPASNDLVENPDEIGLPSLHGKT